MGKEPEVKTYPDPRTEYVQTSINLRDLSKKWKSHKGCSFRMLTRRSKREKWTEQRKAFVAKVAAKSDEETSSLIAETVAQMNKRHIKQSLALAGKALQQILSGRVGNPSNALKMAIDIERLARDEPTDSIETRGKLAKLMTESQRKKMAQKLADVE